MMNEEVLYREANNGYVGYYFDEVIGHVLTCHLVMWSRQDYKRYLPIWGSILNELKHRGISHVFGLCKTEKDKKFNEVFGFVATGDFMTMADTSDERIIMRLEL
jgi:hypothetical protein